MDDARTLATLQMTVALLTSANPNYNMRTVAEVSAELIGSADGIDHTFGICKCPDESKGGTEH